MNGPVLDFTRRKPAVGLDDAAELGEGASQGGGSVLHLQHAHDGAGVDATKLERPRQAQALGFASATQMHALLGVAPGALTPFALINDDDAVVRVLVDATLLGADQVNFHPLINTESTGIRPDDLLTFIRTTGCELIILGAEDGNVNMLI